MAILGWNEQYIYFVNSNARLQRVKWAPLMRVSLKTLYPLT